MTNVNDNVRISDNIGVVASSSSKQLSSIRTLSLPFFILNILLRHQFESGKTQKTAGRRLSVAIGNTKVTIGITIIQV
jgi:hypothetical protein